MQKTLLLRSRIIKAMRDYFAEHNFIDVETPILGRSTPEGARDYLVPSRVHWGRFFALPQSPQLYKQILMVAGYDRYMQVARCFRDEDLRADRQPEFTQLDLEMSFVDAEDIIGMIDGLMKYLAKEILGIELQLPLPRITYDEAMRRFGHDAPDVRYGMEIVDASDLARQTEFRVFRGAVDAGGFVRGIKIDKRAEEFSRKRIDELTDFVKHDFGAKGLAWFRCEAMVRYGRRSARTWNQRCWRASRRHLLASGRPDPVAGRQLGSYLQRSARTTQTPGRRTADVRSQADALLVGCRVPHV